jgi:1,4-dihydroxy-2-naphthoate octaprenyltransferase
MGRFTTWYTILNGTYNAQAEPVQNLDVLSRWLIATRSVVFVMTANAVILGTLLSVIAVGLTPTFVPYFLLLLLGLVLAHATSNLFNDYWDAKHGIDTSEGYFRPAYLPHPIISGMMSSRSLFTVGLIHLAAVVLLASYFVTIRGPVVLLFAGLGILFLILYAGGPTPLKRIGLGEPTVFVVWGPLMVGGTFYVLNGFLPIWVIIASVPYAVVVTTVLLGKHIDKLEYDRELGIRTLPVLLGEWATRLLLKSLIAVAYLAVVALVLTKILPVWSLISLLALPRASQLFGVLSSPRPKESPQGYQLWPIWFLGYVFSHNRRFGALYIAGLILGVFLPFYVSL